jgi:hypothetical protein
MGNSPSVLLRDYRELTTPEVAREWFGVDPMVPSGKIIQLRKSDAKKTS